mgnify:CR=1 FL=1
MGGIFDHIADVNAGRPVPIPSPIVQPVQPSETPGFKGSVTAAEATAKSRIPTPEIYDKLSDSLQQSQAVLHKLNRTESLYNQALKGREPGRIAREYFPGFFGADPVADKIKQFNTSGSQLYSLGSAITRVPGEGSQDHNEFQQKLESFKPNSSDSDPVIEEKISGMRDLLNSRINYLQTRMGIGKPATPNINRAKAMLGTSAPVTLVFDKFGNRVK